MSNESSIFGYDTIHFWLDGGGVDLLDEIPRYLNNPTEPRPNRDGQYFVDGYIPGEFGHDLKVRVYKYRLNVCQGSLCKWYFGNNLQTLTPSETRRALQDIADFLHMDFETSTVTRIDTAANLVTESEPSAYLEKLGHARYFERHTESAAAKLSQVLYRNKERELAFYDKTREMDSRKEVIPEQWRGANIVRTEYRIKRVRKQIGYTVGAKTLCEPPFFGRVLSIIGDTYDTISKQNDTNNLLKMQSFVNLDTYKTLALADYCGGESGYIEFVKDLNRGGGISRATMYREIQNVKKAIAAAVAAGGMPGEKEVAELDRLMRESLGKSLPP